VRWVVCVTIRRGYLHRLRGGWWVEVMRVQLRGYTETDAVLVIECQCGNTCMLDEAGDFEAGEIYVYMNGVPEKNLRCQSSESRSLKRISRDEPECRQRYRISLHRARFPPYLEVAHLSPRPREEVIEVARLNFPEIFT
jgi:hypothetical protein